jgi:predicted methyltransferase
MKLILTEKERRILEGARRSDFGDAYLGEYPWVFDVVEKSRVDPIEARGVLSSLVRKGLIEIESSEEPSLSFTTKGKEVCDLFEIGSAR